MSSKRVRILLIAVWLIADNYDIVDYNTYQNYHRNDTQLLLYEQWKKPPEA